MAFSLPVGAGKSTGSNYAVDGGFWSIAVAVQTSGA